MKPKEFKLAAKFLHLASDLYANHGCNDLDMELLADFTEDERAQLLADYNTYNGGDSEDAIKSIPGNCAAPMSNAGMMGQIARERTPEEIIEHLFTYHPVQDEAQQLKYGMVRDAAKALALQIWKACPYGRDRTRAIDAVRDAVMVANAAIANDGVTLG